MILSQWGTIMAFCQKPKIKKKIVKKTDNLIEKITRDQGLFVLGQNIYSFMIYDHPKFDK